MNIKANAKYYFYSILFFSYRYMKRRCYFLDNCPGFNFNTGKGEFIRDASGIRRVSNTSKLGSVLMRTMLNEVDNFCDPSAKANFTYQAHQQVNYTIRM